MDPILHPPKLPYYAVIFSSVHSDELFGYSEMATAMEHVAQQEEGFLGIESVRNGKEGITVSYWKSLDAVQKWKQNLKHLEAQKLGKEKWYLSYRVRITKVEHDYGSSI